MSLENSKREGSEIARKNTLLPADGVNFSLSLSHSKCNGYGK